MSTDIVWPIPSFLCYNSSVSILKLSKKYIFALFAGSITILLVGIIISALSFLINLRIFGSATTVADISSAYSQQPYVTLMRILGVISFLSPAIGGFIVGWIVKEKGWGYGGIFGILLKVISISISVLLLFVIQTPNLMFDHIQKFALANILNQALNSPITIILSALGGFLGELTHKRIRKEKFSLNRKNIILFVLLIVGLIFYIRYYTVIASVLSSVYPSTKSQSLTEKSWNIKNTPAPEFTDASIEYIKSRYCIIEGQVTDLALKPLKNVLIFEKDGNLSTRTDDNGYYIFKDISPSLYYLTLDLPGYKSSSDGIRVNAGMKIKKNFIMSTIGVETGGVEGIVTDNNRPQQNIEISTLIGGKIVKTKTDINGRYILQDIPPTNNGNKYRIVATKDNYMPISKFIEVSSKVNTKLDFAFSNKLKGIYFSGFLTTSEDNTSSITSIPTTPTNVTIRFTYNRSFDIKYASVPGFYETLGDWQMFPLPNRIAIEISAPGYRTILDEISPKQGTSYIKNYTLKKE